MKSPPIGAALLMTARTVAHATGKIGRLEEGLHHRKDDLECPFRIEMIGLLRRARAERKPFEKAQLVIGICRSIESRWWNEEAERFRAFRDARRSASQADGLLSRHG